MERLILAMKYNAEQGIFSGIIYSPNDRVYMGMCTMRHSSSGTMLIFTRDSGHHSGGWWKNPDYERCYHLSLSFHDPGTREFLPYDKKLAAEWVKGFFGNDDKLTWCEPPCYVEGKQAGVHHYRLFCDPAWQPIKPRGEVYGRELTEIGWKSFSEIHGQEKKA